MVSLKIVLCILAAGINLAIAAPVADNGGELPTRSVRRAAGAGTYTGVVSASPSSVGEYLSPITIDGRTYNVLLDTGSSNLWIKNLTGQTGSGPRWSATYGGVSVVSGTIKTGTVTVGNMTISNQTYGYADTYPTTGYNSYPAGWDGILGLGTSATHLKSNNPSWLSNIMPLLQQPIFAVDMIPASSDSHYTFGYSEPAHMKTSPAVIPADFSRTYWGLTVDSWGVPSGDVSNTGCIVDTGTTWNYVPVSVARGYYSQVQGATSSDSKTWTFPCNATLPAFTPTINGYEFIVDGSYQKRGSATTGTCTGSLNGADSCILGQSFVKDQYIIFDYGKKQMNFARRV